MVQREGQPCAAECCIFYGKPYRVPCAQWWWQMEAPSRSFPQGDKTGKQLSSRWFVRLAVGLAQDEDELALLLWSYWGGKEEETGVASPSGTVQNWVNPSSSGATVVNFQLLQNATKLDSGVRVRSPSEVPGSWNVGAWDGVARYPRPRHFLPIVRRSFPLSLQQPQWLSLEHTHTEHPLRYVPVPVRLVSLGGGEGVLVRCQRLD